MTRIRKKRTVFVQIFCTLCLALLFSLLCIAQSNQGSIFGTMTAPSVAAVPDVVVLTITSVDQGRVRTTKTSANGEYSVTELQAGTRRVRAVHEVFDEPRTFAIEAHARAGIALKVESETATFTVSVANPLLETGSAGVFFQVATKGLHDLPDRSRNIVGFDPLA